MVKMDKMYVNLRNLWGLSWYFIIQGLDQLRDRRLWLVSFVYPFQVSRDFPFFITFKLCIHRKDFTKILSQPKMGKQAEGGSLTRAWSVFFSPVWDNLVPFFLLLSLHLSPPLGNGKEALDSTSSSRGSLTHPQTTPLQKLTCSSFPSKAILRLKAWSSNNLSILLATDVNRNEWSIQHTSDQILILLSLPSPKHVSSVTLIHEIIQWLFSNFQNLALGSYQTGSSYSLRK